MKIYAIELSSRQGSTGKYFFIDQTNLPRVAKYCWTLCGNYAWAKIDKKNVLLHRFLMDAQKGDIVDHIDGNPLNNLMSNLRFVNIKQSNQNRAKSKTKSLTSIYKGVSYVKTRQSPNKWKAAINGQWIGYFATELEAAKAYDRKALELNKDYARTNAMMNLY